MSKNTLKQVSRYLPLAVFVVAIGAIAVPYVLKNQFGMGAADGSSVKSSSTYKKTAPKKNYVSCDKEKEIKSVLSKYLNKTTIAYNLVKLDGKTLNAKIQKKQSVSIPLLNPKGEIVLVSGLGESHESNDRRNVHFKSDDLQALTEISRHLAVIFNCNQQGGLCGNLTFLGDKNSNYQGVFSSPKVGLAAIESVDTLLSSIRKKQVSIEPGCSIVYNAETLGQLSISEGLHDNIVGVVQESEELAALRARVAADLERFGPVNRQIPIVLDGDSKFYELDPDTVWARQSAVLLGVNLIYGWIAPNSTGAFNVTFDIKGQEVWLPDNGPTETDKDKLTDEINAADYFMVTPNQANEISYYFVGYDMVGGIGGQAGSICNLTTDEKDYDTGYGTNLANQNTHAWGQQIADASGYEFSTFLGRVIVAAHEIGHLVGALHSDGANSTCAGGDYPNMCGTSLMLSGAAGGVDPDYRMPFFTPANAVNIATCLRRVD